MNRTPTLPSLPRVTPAMASAPHSPPSTHPTPPGATHRGVGPGGSGGGIFDSSLKYPETLEAMLNGHRHPTLVFDPTSQEYPVLAINSAVRGILGFPSLASIWNLFDDNASIERKTFEAAVMRLPIYGWALVEAIRIQNHKRRELACQANLYSLDWFGRRVSTCEIIDRETCQETLRALQGHTAEPPSDGSLDYRTTNELNQDIRNPESRLCRLLFDEDTKEPVVVRLHSRRGYDTRSAVGVLNQTARGNLKRIGNDIVLRFVFAKDGGGWTTESEWIGQDGALRENEKK